MRVDVNHIEVVDHVLHIINIVAHRDAHDGSAGHTAHGGNIKKRRACFNDTK